METESSAEGLRNLLREKENELKQTRQLLNDTETFLHYGISRLDMPTGELIWSEGLFALVGGRDKVPGKISQEWYDQHINPEERVHVQQIKTDALRNDNFYDLEYTFTQPGQAPRILYEHAKIIRDTTGNVIKTIGVVMDITERRMRDRERERMIHDLNRSNLELEEFAYVASHDLQEPLRKISTFGERLQTRLESALSPETAVYLNRILANTDNMRLLIDDLLEFSRVSRHHPEFQQISLNNVINEVKTELDLLIEETGLIIITDNLPSIEGSFTHICRLFSNLINNSIKFRKSGITPEIRISSAKLNQSELERLRLPLTATYYSILVADNGIGFENEYAQRIFQIFQRLHGKSAYPGSGLGLAICKKIAENHGGFIYAESTPGEGSRFYIILPEKQ